MFDGINFPDIPDEEALDSGIDFTTEDTGFEISADSAQYKQISAWIEATVEKEGKKLGSISYVFCSDDYLHKINMEYLEHDTLTDIITFPYNENPIEGDIFISIDRVSDNASDLKISFEKELNRVLIHGVLHLCGYRDETDEEEAQMRQKEDIYLELLEKMN
jgi:probable rRNA maturation factor